MNVIPLAERALSPAQPCPAQPHIIFSMQSPIEGIHQSPPTVWGRKKNCMRNEKMGESEQSRVESSRELTLRVTQAHIQTTFARVQIRNSVMSGS